MVKIVVGIDGMACGMCEAHINEAVRNAFPVKKVTSSNIRKETVILAERGIPEPELRKVIAEAGMKKKKSVEDYLKTVYILSKNKDVHGADIARAIGVSRPTVCVSLKALEEEGYILMDDAREVHLTEKGLQIAEETYERHNTLC